ncbi:MAG TPA: hypothetical protein VNJ31_10120 [Methyloceanibacter sp.]|nr:hypothetical protein [Methyloceanibacter sp.]
MKGLKDIQYVLAKLDFMRRERIWPNGLRYLWTDAFGLVLLVSLYEALKEQPYLDQAAWLVADVERVLGRKRGIRIGEEPERDGQYFHYLAMWLYALSVLGRYETAYRAKGIALAHAIHRPFVVPGRGVLWKMKEDLSGPYPGYGFGALDAFDGYVSHRALDESALAEEIAEMRAIIDRTAANLVITQDLGLGMMLWMTHFFPEEWWAELQRRRALAMLDRMWRGLICPRRDLPSPITACRSGFRRSMPCPIASCASTTISKPIVRATNMIERPSPMSWPAVPTFPACCSKPSRSLACFLQASCAPERLNLYKI